ncbi:hypothetical protein [Vulcanisaeta sp. JCM 16159]|uniref:hypothetical protein n=1 Tax=Vulcanisaeta sp. JCM 16159 TaxID=1295371 RepID=UPI000AFE6441|nr:hypothetical protein [Vulcanisaeta sp. JCM 16159]
MGPAYTPLPTAFTIPAGASVVVNSTSSFWPCSEEIVYDIDWDVWVSPYMSTTGSEAPVILTSNSQA